MKYVLSPAPSNEEMFKRFQSILDSEFQERFLQPNPYQPVMMGSQAHFIATAPAQKIICSMARVCIVPDGFNVND